MREMLAEQGRVLISVQCKLLVFLPHMREDYRKFPVRQAPDGPEHPL